MTVTPLRRGDTGWATAESAQADQVMGERAELLGHLEDGLRSFARAAESLDELRQPFVDPALCQGRTGRDAWALIDRAVRDGRSAFAVLQLMFAGEGPRP